MSRLTPAAPPERESATPGSRAPRRRGMGDRLYRNDGGHFVDVSERAGLHGGATRYGLGVVASDLRSEEHTSELQSQSNLVCRLLLEKKKNSLKSVRVDTSDEHYYTCAVNIHN